MLALETKTDDAYAYDYSAPLAATCAILGRIPTSDKYKALAEEKFFLEKSN